MKNSRRIILILEAIAFILIAIWFLMSCNEITDTTKPVIELSEPSDESTFNPGDTIWFVCNFSDNEALKTYKIELHENSDGHEHKSAEMDIDNAWHYTGEWSFEDGTKEATIDHLSIVIPDSVNGQSIALGHYHFGVFCADAAGNENHLFVEIEIE